MRSFGLIERHAYPHHRALAKEKPNEPMMKFYSLARSCTQANSTLLPHTAPVAARNAPVWARSHRIDTVPVQPNTAPNFPPLGLSYPRTAFPAQALPGRVSPVQEKPAQISNQINRILKKKIMFTTLAAASAGIGKLKTNKKAAGNRLRLPAALFSKGQFSFSSAHPPGR